MDKEQYNEEKVYFCKDCLSLKISSLEDTDFCENCNSTNISTTNIEYWEELYQIKYKHKFLSNGRKIKL